MMLWCSAIQVAEADSVRCETEVIKIVASQYGMGAHTLSEASRFLIGDAGPNTIEDVEIKQGIEEAFAVVIPEPAWRSFHVIRDIVDYLETHARRCR